MEGHWIRQKKGAGWIIAVPPAVRRQLGVAARTLVYWHVTRKGEAVLTSSEERKAGRPEVTRITAERDKALAELESRRGRDESRDRSMYAEGYAAGYLVAYERLQRPHGASANRARRMRLRHEHGLGRVAVASRERSAAVSIDEYPSPSAPSPSESAGGDAASGGAAPQAAH